MISLDVVFPLCYEMLDLDLHWIPKKAAEKVGNQDALHRFSDQVGY